MTIDRAVPDYSLDEIIVDDERVKLLFECLELDNYID